MAPVRLQLQQDLAQLVVQALGLTVGRPATALFKASSLIVGVMA